MELKKGRDTLRAKFRRKTLFSQMEWRQGSPFQTVVMLIWFAIFLCLAHSAIFSGLNLAYFSVTRLRLESEAKKGNQAAIKVLHLRLNANLLLCTILWGNVSVNVLLALFSDSVMAGVGAFLFSTFGITFFGEIMPQAYFSRHALRAGSILAPVIRFYQILLYPLAKPSSMLLDRWIGAEGPHFYAEEDFEVLLERHVRERSTDIGHAEGRGALNFLRLDDLRVSGEGATLDPRTILWVETDGKGAPVLPMPDTEDGKKFIMELRRTDLKWSVLTDSDGEPLLVINADEFLRRVSCGQEHLDPEAFCHRPIVIRNADVPLDRVLTELIVETDSFDDRLIDREVILYWGENAKRIITGPDLLGRLLHGIALRVERRES